MNLFKYIKYGCLILLCVISFYISDKVILHVENLSPIMKSVKEVSSDYKILPVNATIEGNTIIPGKKGRLVNERESYLKMNEFGAFNENFFVYDYIDPDISLKDNMNKIIVGSSKEDAVALIVDTWNHQELLNPYFYTFVIKNFNDYKNESNVEYINGSLDDYKSMNAFLRNKKKYTNIVLAENSNVQSTTDKYIVSPTINIYHSNVAASLNKIKGGSIIYIHDNVTNAELKLILEKIKYKNLNVMYLSKFISE